MMQLVPYQLYIICFAAALIISMISVPQIIRMASKGQFWDAPDEDRKFHARHTPHLGGIAIFIAYIIVCSIVIQPAIFDKWHYFMATSLLLFITGVIDDINALSAGKKLIAQVIPIAIIVFLGDIRIQSLHGLMGIEALSYPISTALTLLLCIFFTNAFNFIDGIDGLAGSMGALYTGILGLGLALTGSIGAAGIAFALMGATIGFLKYNITPARIFMGDTGSLVLGFTISVLSILFINVYNTAAPISAWVYDSQRALILILAIVSIPVADCIRVFASRIRRGIPPLRADRRHMHYYLLDAGLSHTQAVVAIIVANCIIILLAYLLQSFSTGIIIAAMAIAIILMYLLLYYARSKRMSAAK